VTEFGFDGFILSLGDDAAEQIARLGAEVAPAVRAASA